MKDYLKMADVFPSEIYTDDESGSLIVDGDGVILESFSGDKVADYALHAINSHDELVENMNHYKSEAEMWEGRAVKEASARAGMIIERGELVAMNKELLATLRNVLCDCEFEIRHGGQVCIDTYSVRRAIEMANGGAV